MLYQISCDHLMLSIPKSIHDDTWWYIRHYILYTRIAHISTGQRNNLPEVYMYICNYICIYLNIYRTYTYIYIQTYIRHTQSYPLRPFEDLLLWHPSPGLGKRSAGLQVGPNNPTMKKNNSKGRRIEGGLQLGILGKFWNMFRNWLIFNLMYNINCHKLPLVWNQNASNPCQGQALQAERLLFFFLGSGCLSDSEWDTLQWSLLHLLFSSYHIVPIYTPTRNSHDNWSLSEDSKEATVGRDMEAILA